jgi:Double zinc ribbon
VSIRCSCLRDNDPWRRFCGRCGDPLGPACPSCRFVNTSADKYCGGCGHPIEVAAKRTMAIPKVAAGVPKGARTAPPSPPPKTKTVPIETMDEVLVISEAPVRVDEGW